MSTTLAISPKTIADLKSFFVAYAAAERAQTTQKQSTQSAENKSVAAPIALKDLRFYLSFPEHETYGELRLDVFYPENYNLNKGLQAQQQEAIISTSRLIEAHLINKGISAAAHVPERQEEKYQALTKTGKSYEIDDQAIQKLQQLNTKTDTLNLFHMGSLALGTVVSLYLFFVLMTQKSADLGSTLFLIMLVLGMYGLYRLIDFFYADDLGQQRVDAWRNIMINCARLEQPPKVSVEPPAPDVGLSLAVPVTLRGKWKVLLPQKPVLSTPPTQTEWRLSEMWSFCEEALQRVAQSRASQPQYPRLLSTTQDLLSVMSSAIQAKNAGQNQQDQKDSRMRIKQLHQQAQGYLKVIEETWQPLQDDVAQAIQPAKSAKTTQTTAAKTVGRTTTASKVSV